MLACVLYVHRFESQLIYLLQRSTMCSIVGCCHENTSASRGVAYVCYYYVYSLKYLRCNLATEHEYFRIEKPFRDRD